jgi:large subunit ribosomal protein L23
MKVHNIIIKPRITEKALKLSESGVYLFEVNEKANKDQIRDAIEQLFKVEVGEITTSIKKGKTKRIGKKRQEKEMPHMKVAYIKVKTGKIDVFPKTK